MHTFSEIRKLHEEISMEAVANPLASLSFKLRHNFKKVIGHFSDVTSNTPNTSLGRADVSVYKLMETNSERIRTIGYIAFKDIKVPVPPGFKGEILKLAKLLQRANTLNEHIIDRALKPAHDLFLKYIGKPELLSAINVDDFKKIDTFANEINDIKKELNLLFDFNYNYQSQKFVTLYKNLADFQESNKFLGNVLYPQYVQCVNRREKINRYYSDVGKCLDLLLLKLEQNPNKYAINNLTSERISNLVLELALAVEFVGLMQVYSDQLLATSIETGRLINTYVNDKDVDLKQWVK